MLIVSFRGVNFGFWCHLGCSGQNAIIIIFNHKVSFRVAHRNIKTFIFNSFYLLLYG